MKTIQIEVTANANTDKARALKFPFAMPETVAEAVKKFGEVVVLSHFVDSVTIAFQANARGKMAKEGDKRKSDKDITLAMATWGPKLRASADPEKRVADIKASVAKMDPETRKALLAELAKA